VEPKVVLTVGDVMTQGVVTVRVGESVKNAARLMERFGISCLLVFSDNGLKGIITERDIVTRVVCTGLDPNEAKVEEAMTEPVIVVGPDTPLDKAVETMLLNRIKKLPVLQRDGENYQVLGILSIMDVARLHPELVSSIKQLLEAEEELEADFYVS